MQHIDHFSFLNPAPAPGLLSTAEYLRLLHPENGHGLPTLMAIRSADDTWSKILSPSALPFAAEASLDESLYVTHNRFYGQRRTGLLASLNAVFLDLDYYRLPDWSDVSAVMVAQRIEADLRARGIPFPSFTISTGRGLAVLWLIDPLPPEALARWQAALRTLIGLYRTWGADPACSDAARVFRVPGSTHLRTGRMVRVIGGTLGRVPFDDLANAIYRAVGRPTRPELDQRRRTEKAKVERELAEGTVTRGLAPAPRFRQVLRDLDRLGLAWGGLVPEGLRNTWLHLYATALTHTEDLDHLEEIVEAMAAVATPGLPSGEVRALIRSARQRGTGRRSSIPGRDPRLHYSGARMAEMLGVTDDVAERLGLEQIYSTELRAARKAKRQTNRRRADGVVPRETYLAQRAVSRVRPWLEAGCSRAAWYRRRAAEPAIVVGDQVPAASEDAPSV